MTIKIGQVAIGVPRGQSEKMVSEIREKLGAIEWVFDTVKFSGDVFGKNTDDTEAKLNFNYDLIPGVEFEILEYVRGSNWHEERLDAFSGQPIISHLGLHIDDWDEFCEVRDKLLGAGIEIAQEANTFSHSNENIPSNRKYHYLILDTIFLFGFDLKLIYRRNTDDE